MNKTAISDTPHPKVYEALAAAFRAEDIEVFFALLGDGNMHFGSTLAELGVRGIYARHEHCACAMATMYSNATGKVGVATVTCGPGLTQTMTALVTAVKARLPLVVFAGEAPMDAVYHTQSVNQGPIVEATGARYITAHSLPRLMDNVRDAFFLAKTERRPVVLGVPFDLQKQTLGRPFSYAPSRDFVPHVELPLPNPIEVDRAAAAIRSGKRVVVLAGRGVVWSGARAECIRLADSCGGVLANTLLARGLFDDHPFGVGICGGYATPRAKHILAEADVVVAVGTTFGYFTADRGKLFANATIIQINPEPLGITQGRKTADIYARADAKAALAAILERLPDAPDRSWRSSELARLIADRTPEEPAFHREPGVIDPREAVAALDDTIPKDWEMVTGSGYCAHFTTRMHGRNPENYNVIRDFGPIGNGLPNAIGVAAAKPDRPIVVIDGDGSLMMHVQELETVRRHGFNLLICVLNDGAYGSEIHKMRSDGISEAGAVHGRGDLAAVARAFGLRGSTITDVGQMPAVFEAFRASGGAELWDIRINDKVTTGGRIDL